MALSCPDVTIGAAKARILASAFTLALAALAGCDTVFGLDDRAADAAIDTGVADAADSAIDRCEREDFSGTFVDLAARWDRYPVTALATDATTDVTGGILQFTLPPGVAENNYTGIRRNETKSFVGASLELELVSPATQVVGYDLYMKLEQDSDDSNSFLVLVSVSTMHLIHYVGGVANEDAGTFIFDPVAQRFWRIRHRVETHEVVLETSPNGVVWVARLAYPDAAFSLNQIRLEVGAGTYMAQTSVLRPQVDNVTFCPP